MSPLGMTTHLRVSEICPGMHAVASRVRSHAQSKVRVLSVATLTPVYIVL